MLEDVHWAEPTFLDLRRVPRRLEHGRPDRARLPRTPGAARRAPGVGGRHDRAATARRRGDRRAPRRAPRVARARRRRARRGRRRRRGEPALPRAARRARARRSARRRSSPRVARVAAREPPRQPAARRAGGARAGGGRRPRVHACRRRRARTGRGTRRRRPRCWRSSVGASSGPDTERAARRRVPLRPRADPRRDLCGGREVRARSSPRAARALARPARRARRDRRPSPRAGGAASDATPATTRLTSSRRPANDSRRAAASGTGRVTPVPRSSLLTRAIALLPRTDPGRLELECQVERPAEERLGMAARHRPPRGRRACVRPTSAIAASSSAPASSRSGRILLHGQVRRRGRRAHGLHDAVRVCESRGRSPWTRARVDPLAVLRRAVCAGGSTRPSKRRERRRARSRATARPASRTDTSPDGRDDRTAPRRSTRSAAFCESRLGRAGLPRSHEAHAARRTRVAARLGRRASSEARDRRSTRSRRSTGRDRRRIATCDRGLGAQARIEPAGRRRGGGRRCRARALARARRPVEATAMAGHTSSDRSPMWRSSRATTSEQSPSPSEARAGGTRDRRLPGARVANPTGACAGSARASSTRQRQLARETLTRSSTPPITCLAQGQARARPGGGARREAAIDAAVAYGRGGRVDLRAQGVRRSSPNAPERRSRSCRGGEPGDRAPLGRA